MSFLYPILPADYVRLPWRKPFMSESVKEISISVRNLVEFIMRSGDLDNTRGGRDEIEAMRAGGRIHRKLQKQMGRIMRPRLL